MRLSRLVGSLFAFALALSLQSCLTYYPNLIKTPLFTHKGEGHGAAYLSNNGVDAYAAYAVSDHAAVIASGAMGFNDQSNTTDTHAFGEIGVGYYDAPAPRWTREAFIGGGFGQSYTLQSNSASSAIVGNYVRGYVSSDMAYSLGWADIGVAARVAGVDFVSGRESINGNPFGVFIEPAAFGRVGWSRLKLEGQVGMSWHVFSTPGFGAQKLFYGIGMHFVLPAINE